MVHGGLLPLDAVPQNLHPRLHLQVFQGDSGVAPAQLFIGYGHADLKKPVVLHHTPVAHIAVGGMHADDKLRVLDQAVVKCVHHLVRHQRTVLEILHGLHPVFAPDSRFQNSPGSFLRLRRPLNSGDPVHQQFHETPGVFLIPGDPVGLAQADKIPMPVKLVDEFRVVPGFVLPVHLSLRKYHRLPGPLHIPFQVKEEIPPAHLVRHPDDMAAFLRPVFPAVCRHRRRIVQKHPLIPARKQLLFRHLVRLLYQ